MNSFKKQLRSLSLPLALAVVIATLMTALSGVLVAIDIKRISDVSVSQAEMFNEHLFTHLELVTEQAETATKALAIYISSSETDFDKPADQVFLDGLAATIPDWRNISVSPDNCISAVSPRRGNESAIGYCLESNQTEWSDISKIIAKKSGRILGPYVLAQGGSGYILHRPVFLKDGSYWGLVSTVIEKQSFLQPLLDAAKSDGFDFDLVIGDAANTDLRTMYVGVDPNNKAQSTKVFETRRNTFTITSTQIDVDYTSATTVGRRMIVISLIATFSAFLFALMFQRQGQIRRKLEDVSRKSPTGLFQVRLQRDGSLNLDYLSEGVKNLLGHTAADLISNPSLLREVFTEADLEVAIRRLSAAKAPGEAWSQRFELKQPVGKVRYVQAEATFERELSTGYKWNGFFADVTSNVEKEDALALAANAIAILDQGVAILDADLNIIEINAAITKATGYLPEEVVGQNLMDFGHGINSAEVYASIQSALSKTGYWRGQLLNRHKTGNISQDFLTLSAVKKSTGEIAEIVMVMNSTQDSLVDLVSGLANRTLFEDYLGQAIQSSREDGHRVALLHIGVVGIGSVNDSFGHKIGDLVLGEIGQRLKPFTATGKCLGRIADSEFGLYREMKGGDEDLDDLAKRIVESLSQPFIFDDVNLLLKVSVGIAEYPDDSETVAELRTHADQAHKFALTADGWRVSHFSKNLEDSAKAKSYLTSYLKEAIENNSIEFYYQPIVQLADGQITKAEVLARWFDEHLGQVSPARFIPLAENTNLINTLGNQLLTAALQTIREVEKTGKSIQLSVNVSPNEFMSASFEPDKKQIFAEHLDVNTENIVFELTEGVLVKNKELVQSKIAEFDAQGIKFAIDDFGTGYSSLAYLQELSVDFIKIDKVFVDAIETVEGNALCRSIVDLAHALNLEVIAEGVETAQQVDELKRIGCEYGQGYFYSKPLSKTDFMKLLEAK